MFPLDNFFAFRFKRVGIFYLMKIYPIIILLSILISSCTQTSNEEGSILIPIFIIGGISTWFLLPTLWMYRKTIFRLNSEDEDSGIQLVKNPREEKYLNSFIKVTKYIAIPVLLFSSLLIIDDYLPLKEYKESIVYVDEDYFVIEGSDFDYYMDGIYTQNFFFVDETDESLEKYNLVKVYTSCIFGIIKEVKTEHDNFQKAYSIGFDADEFYFMVIILFILSLIILVSSKKYSVLIFVLGVVKYLILVIYLSIFFFYF